MLVVGRWWGVKQWSEVVACQCVSRKRLCARLFTCERTNCDWRVINPMRKMLPCVFYALFYFLQDVKRRLAGHSSTRCSAGLRRAEGVDGGVGGGGGVKRRFEWRPVWRKHVWTRRSEASDLELEDLPAGRNINLHRCRVSRKKDGGSGAGGAAGE